MNTLFVNFLSGPCGGKSTLAAGLFHRLKAEGIDAALVTEFAKDCAWEGNQAAFTDQFYLTGVQHYRQHVLNGKVPVVVTDSPLIFGLLYYETEDLVLREAFTTFVLRSFTNQRNLNFRVHRGGTYNPVGRVHNEDQARELDQKLDHILESHAIPVVGCVTTELAFVFNSVVDHLNCAE